MTYFLIFLFELFFLWRLSRKVNSFLLRNLPTGVYALLFLPGTFLHELSHYLVALILRVPVGKFTITPKIYEKEVVLGSVEIAKKDVFRRTAIGISPIFVGIAMVLLIVFASLRLEVYSGWQMTALIAYLIFTIGNTMFSSKKDLEGAWKVFVVLVVLFAVFYFFGVRISVEHDFEIFKLASVYLLAPISIDLVLLLPISLRRR